VPVIAVAGDEEIHLALRDDFDLPPTATSGDILDVVEAVFSGEQSAAERRGAADFVLRRMARTM
jgi:hypothetical protein